MTIERVSRMQSLYLIFYSVIFGSLLLQFDIFFYLQNFTVQLFSVLYKFCYHNVIGVIQINLEGVQKILLL